MTSRRDVLELGPRRATVKIQWAPAGEGPTAPEDLARAQDALEVDFQNGLLEATLATYLDGYRLDRAHLFRAGIGLGNRGANDDVRGRATRVLNRAGFRMYDERGELVTT